MCFLILTLFSGILEKKSVCQIHEWTICVDVKYIHSEFEFIRLIHHICQGSNIIFQLRVLIYILTMNTLQTVPDIQIFYQIFTQYSIYKGFLFTPPSFVVWIMKYVKPQNSHNLAAAIIVIFYTQFVQYTDYI